MPEPRPLQAVALDASLWDEPTTGIGLYTRCLAAALADEEVFVRRIGARTSGEHPRGAMGRSIHTLAVLPQLLARCPEPVFHALGNFNLPLVAAPGKRLVLTVHDLIPEVMPRTVSAGFRWQFRLWLARSLRLAARVICVSETTRRDLLDRFDLPPSRVAVVHNGVDHVDAIPAPDAAGEAYLRALGLPRQFVLYAGALDARKNVEGVLAASERARAAGQGFTLVVAGQRWFGAGPIEQHITRLRAAGVDVRPLGYLEAPVFYALMRRATAFVFPSRYEGFGLPPLEAMRLGVPTVVSTAGALPEICGGAAIAVDPDDAEALAGTILRLLNDPKERSDRAEAGRARAAGFTWSRAAAGTLAVYADALGEES